MKNAIHNVVSPFVTIEDCLQPGDDFADALAALAKLDDHARREHILLCEALSNAKAPSTAPRARRKKRTVADAEFDARLTEFCRDFEEKMERVLNRE